MRGGSPANSRSGNVRNERDGSGKSGGSAKNRTDTGTLKRSATDSDWTKVGGRASGFAGANVPEEIQLRRFKWVTGALTCSADDVGVDERSSISGNHHNQLPRYSIVIPKITAVQ